MCPASLLSDRLTDLVGPSGSPRVPEVAASRPFRPERQVALLLANLGALSKDLKDGAIVVIEPARIRIRALPLLP